MGILGPEGELDFSAEELADMQVDVAGREDSTAAPRKKRALRVPADEVPRGPLVASGPEQTLSSADLEETDELVDHAFTNGGRAEAHIAAKRLFAVDSEVAAKPKAPHVPPGLPKMPAHAPDDDLEPEITVSKPERAELVEAISKLPPNMRALMRAVVPEPHEPKRAVSAESTEQLDSSELETIDPTHVGQDYPAFEHAITEPGVTALDAAQDSASDSNTEEYATIEAIAGAPVEVTQDAQRADSNELALEEEPDGEPLTASTAAAEELEADDVTEDDEIPQVARRLTPPTPPPLQATPRVRSITPIVVPSPPSIAPATPPLAPPPPPQADELRPRRRRRVKQWFEDIFDDDYLRTLPFLSATQTEREAQFVSDSLGLEPGASLLDVGCGYGRHAMELAGRGHKVTGIDLSLPLLIRAADAARRIGVSVNFVHGDMREMTFDGEFDGAYCLFTSFGYFDDDTNRKVAANLARALKPGGRVLIELVNRDYICRDLPTRVWWQGEGCVVLEEVDFNYFSSRLQVQRSIIFEEGRQVEQEISIRAYSLHEIGKVLHHAGFRVIEVSGGLSLRGTFFGAHSRQLLVVAEKKP